MIILRIHCKKWFLQYILFHRSINSPSDDNELIALLSLSIIQFCSIVRHVQHAIVTRSELNRLLKESARIEYDIRLTLNLNFRWSGSLKNKTEMIV